MLNLNWLLYDSISKFTLNHSTLLYFVSERQKSDVTLIFLMKHVISLFRNTSTSVIDDKWHHVCASWGEVQMSGVLQIYIDGQIKLKEPRVDVENPVTGTQHII